MKSTAAFMIMMAASGTASANISAMIFEITATDEVSGASASATYFLDASRIDNNGNYNWELPEAVTFEDQGIELGGLNTASVSIAADPVIAVDFNVFATAQNTSFQVNSAVLTFDTISASNAQAVASAAVTLQDFNGDGVVFTPGSQGAYNAFFNNGTSLFTDLFPSGSQLTGAGFSNPSFAADSGGFVPAGIDISSISAAWDFTLSAGDLATGSSVFEVIPAPSTAALLGLGGLAAARRRR
ncbi:MAG: PEP-CTERM sorting domain-containing protein [Planctomycetota bacterium]